MTLPRTELTAGYFDELERFTELVRSLDAAEWGTPSRCEGWTVADVAAHVVGQVTDLVEGRFDGLGTPEVTQRQVVERRGRTPGELADELTTGRKAMADLVAVFDDDAWNGPAPGGIPGTLGEGVEALYFDTFLHADDMRAAAGRASEIGPGLDVSLSHVAIELDRMGWGPGTLALDGHDEHPVGAGGDPRITGDPMQFVLAATGRTDAASLGFDPSVNIYA